MEKHRKQVKDMFNSASRTKYYGIVDEAKIFTEDKKILDARFVEGLSIVAIAMRLGYSVEKVNHTIRKCYDKIYGITAGA